VLHAIPEALVLGIMYNDRARESDYTPESSLGTGSNRLVAFAAALLLSKLPEALVASEALQQRGHGGTRVIGMWSGLVAISAACSFFISLAFDPARAKPRAAHAAQAAVEGVCGGMLGARVLNSILPEASQKAGGPAGSLIGVAGMLGFVAVLCASAASSSR